MKLKSLLFTLILSGATISVWAQKEPSPAETALTIMVQEGKVSEKQASEATVLIREREKKYWSAKKKSDQEAAKVSAEYNEKIRQVLGSSYSDWMKKTKELRN